MIKVQGIGDTYLNIFKAICNKPRGKTPLYREELDSFPLKAETSQACKLSQFLFNIQLHSWLQQEEQRMQSRNINRNKKRQSVLF